MDIYAGLSLILFIAITFVFMLCALGLIERRDIRNRERILMHMNWLSKLGLYETSFLMYKPNRPYVLSKKIRREWFGSED